MYLVTAAEMGQLDRLASSEYLVPSIVLMENAGLRVVESIRRHFQDRVKNRRVLIFCGKGNNGGDGLVVARHLLNQGAEVKVFLLARPEDLRGDARTNLEIYQKMGGRLYPILGESHLQRADIALLYADLVVDAIFGTGFKGAAMGLPAAVITMINKAHRVTVAVDLPSGLEADTGRAFGPCIQATWTVTFALPKLGLAVEPGASYAGRLEVADIGIPQKLIDSQRFNLHLLTTAWCRSRLPKRDASSHKGLYGHVLAVGGSPGLTGAITLAAAAALRAGAGLVTAAVPQGVHTILEMKTTEVMTCSLPETPGGYLSREALDPILERLAQCDVLALGPGLSRDPATMELVKELLPRLKVPAVVDADALNALATDTSILTGDHGPLVLTPHPGEMARLVGTTAARVQEDRLEIARKYAREWQVVLVLKGARTIIAWPDGQAYINPTGNPGMATAGSGDVLTGIIAGLMAQGLEPGVAAALGAFLHGAAGDEARASLGQYALLAGDLLNFLPAVCRNLEVEAGVTAGLGRD
ncbi:MAG: ADP-dependent NAD(P)H-hydrate dehydratase / NAD(P)H-hydrate epimerase [Moorella sp. (in: firmicutes)]|jgi:NAD(P)H-hydrate epimerase|uniref:NAD(P)H-hydrate dehydratase n=1 Tax=Moorella sp. E306M TaxID=2572683 RepID=UPI0010FFC37E|nr:NAD(P)H-hydrate dehydratase [Moorella sp. E306M]MDK2817489.1 ADP-dependent NAD(P)H-hydrate dehydratase / NAD(P)H-hydrate epimerase [Moorella sp. (in: firmicutes)]GEA18530.1 bifunctional NAD(P)H-hydrate repair enzyme Nnr [Moorella sp. E306M]